MTLERGKAWEFEPFVTPQYSCTVDDKAVLLMDKKGFKETTNIPVTVKAETEVTTKLQYDDFACEQQIVEENFGAIFGKFSGNEDVDVKRMKDVDASDAAMDEFAKESSMLDKFRCEQVVHFYGACHIPNHAMMVTEYAPCGSLADCIEKQPDPENRSR